jgi:hypothetical protein
MDPAAMMALLENLTKQVQQLNAPTAPTTNAPAPQDEELLRASQMEAPTDMDNNDGLGPVDEAEIMDDPFPAA